MTIKTLKQDTSSSCSISTQSKNTFSDMPKKGAVRNLFNTAVDRKELNHQMQSVESKNKRALGNYKLDSVIGVIKRSDDDQQRRLKYLPANVKEDTKRSSFSANNTLRSMMLESATTSSSSSSSTTATASSYKSTESSSKISTATKAINQTLPKGQKTIKDYYPTVKRSRQNHR